jgi:3',5'-cyclic AMP phosphodiesterase CpdA
MTSAEIQCGDQGCPKAAVIVHISDLHFGRNLASNLLEVLKNDLVSLSPSHIVVSGDLVDNPWPWKMKQAGKYLYRLQEACCLSDKELLTVPGNHDVRIWGNIGLSDLSRIAYQVEIVEQGHKQNLRWRILRYLSLFFYALWPWRKRKAHASLCFAREFKHVAFVGFNSNPSFFSLAQGFVHPRQIQACYEKFAPNPVFTNGETSTINPSKSSLSDDVTTHCCDESQQLAGGDSAAVSGPSMQNDKDEKLRVAVLHHHPMAIPYAPTNRAARLTETFMILHNAGTFMREMARSGVDLILHGHKHYSGFASVQYDLTSSYLLRKRVGVLAAGSATKRSAGEQGGNQINIVTLHGDGTADIERRFYSPDGMREHDRRGTMKLFDMGDVRDRRQDALRRKIGLTAQRITRSVEITPIGRSIINDIFDNVRVFGTAESNGFAFDLDGVKRPYYVRRVERLDFENTPHGALTRRERNNEKGDFHGYIRFSPPKRSDDGPFRFGYTYWLIAGHSTNGAEASRRFRGKPEKWEHASASCDMPAEELVVELIFPDRKTFDSVSKVWSVARFPWSDSGGSSPRIIEHGEESSRLAGLGILKDEEKYSFGIRIPNPIPDFQYCLRWTYREESNQIPLIEKENVSACCRDLLKLEAGSATYGFVVEALEAFITDIEARYPENRTGEKLEASVAVWDEQEAVLRVVAATFLEPATVREINFMPGEGCTGLVFEKQEVMLLSGRGTASDAVFLRPSEAPNSMGPIRDYEALLTVPWRTPSGYCGGVVSVGSGEKASRLLHFESVARKGKKSEERESKELTALASTLGAAICKYCLSHGGGSQILSEHVSEHDRPENS